MKENINLFTKQTMRDMGKRIQEERKNKGFKAIDFADIIGIGKDQLSRIENGRVACKIEYLYVMAQYLNISTDYILFGSTNNEINVERNLEKKRQIIQLLEEF